MLLVLCRLKAIVMLRSFDAHKKGLGGAVYVGGSPLDIVTGGEDGKLHLRQADNPSKQLKEIKRGDANAIYCVAVHPSRSQFAVGYKGKGVQVSVLFLKVSANFRDQESSSTSPSPVMAD